MVEIHFKITQETFEELQRNMFLNIIQEKSKFFAIKRENEEWETLKQEKTKDNSIQVMLKTEEEEQNE